MLLSALAASLPVAYTQIGAPPQTGTGWEVTGTVVSDSGPVRGVYVTISGPEAAFTKTDGEGRYSLKGKQAGSYLITVGRKENMSAPRPRSVTLAGGVRLKVQFRIPKGAVLSGRVFDENREPVSGVTVLAFLRFKRDGKLQLQMEGGDRTNDLGAYRIPYLRDGTYVVAAVSDRVPLRKGPATGGSLRRKVYPPTTFYPGSRSLDGAAPVTVRSGQEHPNLDLVIHRVPGICISFKVAGALSKPGTTSTASLMLKDWVGAEAATVAEGPVTEAEQYQVCGLTAGEYRFHVTSYVESPFEVIGYGRSVAVVDKLDVDLGILDVLRPRELRGAMALKGAKAGEFLARGIRVRLAPSLRSLAIVATNSGEPQEDGSFVLDRVFADDYGVRVDGLPERYYLFSASQQGKNVLDGGLWPGNGDLQIVLGTDGASVRGRVLGSDGEAVPDATVILVPATGRQALVTQADQTGAYRIVSGVPPGEYRVIAVDGLPQSLWQDSETASRLAARGIDLELAAGESRTLDVKARPEW